MFYLSLYPTTHIVKHLPFCRYSNNIFSLKVQVHVSVLQTVTESGLTLYKMTILLFDTLLLHIPKKMVYYGQKHIFIKIYKYTHIHIYTMEYYSAGRKNEILPFAAIWMDLENTKWNKSDRERQILYDITYTQNLRNTTSDHNKEEADTQI